MRKKRVAIAINASWNIVNFRAGLVRALVAEGYDVLALAPEDAYSTRLSDLGCRYVPVPMDNKGTSPLQDLRLLLRFRRILRRERVDAFLGYTIKPNTYGSLAAHTLGIPVINNVSGLGTAFIRETWLTRVVKLLYRSALGRSRLVFFQNEDDRTLFVEAGLVDAGRTALLPGSGIDLDRYRPASADDPSRDGAFRFLLVARLLWDKGVGEFVEAARLVRARVPGVRFQLLGFLDVENRTAVSRATVEGWVAEGVVEYLGTSDDVRPLLGAADCVVLPSYREGTPRTLLEAAAMAKPLIATDVPGCREVVDDGRNGYLCPVRDAAGLADRMLRMLEASPEARERMGQDSRAKVEREFDERIVIRRYLDALSDLFTRS
jgi:glycosyltransferase involved in cell wall biosynthesis